MFYKLQSPHTCKITMKVQPYKLYNQFHLCQSACSAHTFVLFLLLGNFPQLLGEVTDDLLLLQLLVG